MYYTYSMEDFFIKITQMLTTLSHLKKLGRDDGKRMPKFFSYYKYFMFDETCLYYISNIT